MMTTGADESQLPSRVALCVDATPTGEHRQSKTSWPGHDEIGYEAAVPDRAASHRAPPAISFLYLISARG
jgi:hypothetical protein